MWWYRMKRELFVFSILTGLCAWCSASVPCAGTVHIDISTIHKKGKSKLWYDNDIHQIDNIQLDTLYISLSAFELLSPTRTTAGCLAQHPAELHHGAGDGDVLVVQRCEGLGVEGMARARHRAVDPLRRAETLRALLQQPLLAVRLAQADKIKPSFKNILYSLLCMIISQSFLSLCSASQYL